jgi:hypothetical protein
MISSGINMANALAAAATIAFQIRFERLFVKSIYLN